MNQSEKIGEDVLCGTPPSRMSPKNVKNLNKGSKKKQEQKESFFDFL